MGIGLSEYRAAVGAFAWIAASTSLRWRSKAKSKKSSRPRAVANKERSETKVISANPVQIKKRSMSLDQCRTRERSKTVGRRSKTLNQREHGVRSCKQVAFRTRSQSHVERGKKIPDATFKNSCIPCKTELFKEKWERGRSCKRLSQPCKGHFSHAGEEPKRPVQLQFLIVQMLLVRAGIETNPGPTSPTSSACCNAYQHFRRVENTIEKAQNNFQSKTSQDTLTMKVIEIEETGKYLSFSFRGNI